jgi:micrococcal nuclease
MARRLLLLGASSAGALLTLLAVSLTPTAQAHASAGQGAFTYRGVVTKIVDGDTIDARLHNGRIERVRLIGIDTPERGDCFFAQASTRARALALGKRVVLRGDTTQDTRDRYGRLLAYVDIGSTDMGRALIRTGHAETYVYRRPFQRLATYRAAETAAKTAAVGLWSGCATVSPPPNPPAPPAPVVPPPPPVAPTSPPPPPAPPATPDCDPSYPTVCIPPPPPDLDCKDIPHRNFPVVGADPHRFDGNRDGRGCEG